MGIWSMLHVWRMENRNAARADIQFVQRLQCYQKFVSSTAGSKDTDDIYA